MTNHTDTSHSDDLVERLRKHVFYGDARLFNFKKHSPLAMEAADLIETVEAENERLREALHGISEFGERHPGHGYSCHLLARAALGDKQ